MAQFTFPIRETLKAVIQSEAAALATLLERVSSDEAFVIAAQRLFECRGKVITTGVGKSGQIAAKIASTMTSTGTTALYLHPTEALHGDLGMVSPGDLVIAFGKSGETAELNGLCQVLKQLRCPVIAITSSPQSTLGALAELVLNIGASKEAGPGEFVPTASTAAMLALGDALAIALMQLKGFEPRDFARYHPGGHLGQRLLREVRDLMVGLSDVIPISGATPVREAILTLGRTLLGVVGVTDTSGALTGILTDGDIRRLLAERGDAMLKSTVQELMTQKPLTVLDTTLALEALRFMEDRPRPLNVVPVVDSSGKLVGMLRLHDLLRVQPSRFNGEAHA